MVRTIRPPLLTWREAQVRDRDALRAFECTAPKPTGPLNWRKPHPRPWELRVQSGIREENPKRRDTTMLIGLDTGGIGAVACWTLIRGEGYKICAIAVARRHRGQQGEHAREALQRCLSDIETDAIEREGGFETVYAWIDHRNWRSQALFHGMGFVKGREVTDDLVEWTYDLNLIPGSDKLLLEP